MRKPNRVFIIFFVLSLVYLAINLLIPEDMSALERYGLSVAQVKLLKLTIFLPYVAVWFSAFLGFSRLKEYARIIHNGRDGKALSDVADGLLVMAVGLPVTALASTVVNYLSRVDSWLVPAASVLSLYLDVAISLVAFGLIFKGAKKLQEIVKVKQNNVLDFVFLAAYSFLGVSFTVLTLTNEYRQFPDTNGQAAYYLPDFLLVTTAIIPILVIWFMGFSAAFGIWNFRQNVKGVIYRKGLGLLASGLLLVIMSRVVLRYLSSVQQILAGSSLKLVLIIVYCLLGLIASGFVLIAAGAKKLKKIEEV